MKIFLIVILFLYYGVGYAQINSVNVIPEKPIVNKIFQLKFSLIVNDHKKFFLDFDADNFEVMKKEVFVKSIKSIIKDGKIRAIENVEIVYSLVASSYGSFMISNINLEDESEDFSWEDLRIKVLAKAIPLKKIFLRSEISNEDAFVGEGITVDYWLYFKLNITSDQVKKFPKLDGFLKRFHIPQEQAENVVLNGENYKKVRKYSARIFAGKAKKYKIDPLKIQLQYQKTDYTQRGFVRYGTSTLSSKNKYIKIKNIDPLSMDPQYSGLVGDHKFKIIVNNKKFRVNEPIEFKLEIVGEGALENFAAPVLFKFVDLEEFETTSSFIEISNRIAKKVFTYTYLPRKQMTLPARKIVFITYDPSLNKMIKKNVEIPEIKVTSEDIQNDEGPKNLLPTAISTKIGLVNNSENNSFSVISPSFSLPLILEKSYSNINYFLVFLIILILLFYFRGQLKSVDDNEVTAMLKTIQREGITYGDLMRLLFFLGKKEGESVDLFLKGSSITEDIRKYIVNLADYLEKKEFVEGINIHEKIEKDQLYSLLDVFNVKY